MAKKVDEEFLKMYPIPRKFYYELMFRILRRKRWCR